jgi:hypothetical protein
MTYEGILRALIRRHIQDGFEVERNFRPYLAFRRRSAEKVVSPAYDEDDTRQSVFDDDCDIDVRSEWVPVAGCGVRHSFEFILLENYLELKGHLKDFSGVCRGS